MWILIYIHISKNRGGGDIYTAPPYICSGGGGGRPPCPPPIPTPLLLPIYANITIFNFSTIQYYSIIYKYVIST